MHHHARSGRGHASTCDVGRLLAPFGTTPGRPGPVTIVAEVPPPSQPANYANIATAIGAVGTADDQSVGPRDRESAAEPVDHQVVPERTRPTSS